MKPRNIIISSSITLLVLINIFQFLNFIFQFSMVRLLSVAEYGVLVTLFSITYILGIFSDSIQLVIAKYTSSEDSAGRLKNILKKSLRKSLFLSGAIYFIYALVSIGLSIFLDISYYLLALNGLVIFFIVALPVTRGILQGRRRFWSLGNNLILEAGSKLVLAIAFVVFGFGVWGAIGAVICSVAIALTFSMRNLSGIISAHEERSATPSIYSYSWPVFFVILSITVFYSLDVIIARIVFDEQTAGYYAVASILAKVVFWGTQPISKAMFSISAENRLSRPPQRVLANSLTLLLVILLVGLCIIYYIPNLLIRFFSGECLDTSASILFYLSVGMGFLSIANLHLLYKLSVNRARWYWVLGVFLLIEIGFLFIFSGSIAEFSLAYMISALLFLGGAIFFTR